MNFNKLTDIVDIYIWHSAGVVAFAATEVNFLISHINLTHVIPETASNAQIRPTDLTAVYSDDMTQIIDCD